MNNLIPNGFIDVDGGLATLTFKRRLAHPIEEVWAAITDPKERGDWFGTTVIDDRAGGTIEMVAEGPPVSREQRTITGRIRGIPAYLRTRVEPNTSRKRGRPLRARTGG
jgi:hypothetical protein